MTHPASGAIVSPHGWPDRASASTFAQRLRPQADWTRHHNQLRVLDIELAERTRAIERQLCAELGLSAQLHSSALVLQIDGIPVDDLQVEDFDADQLTQLIAEVRTVHDTLVDELAARLHHQPDLLHARASAVSRDLDRVDRISMPAAG